jgi:uncharacterized membrane protein YfcA
VDLPVLALLAVIGLAGGIGISTVGPGGVLPTIGLLALTGLSPAEVAGTAIVTHIATGVVGTLAYTRSGQLRARRTQRIALVLAATALLGTPLGVITGTMVSKQVFTMFVGAVVAAAAGMLWYRGRSDSPSPVDLPTAMVVAIGLSVSAVSGLVGIGGPMLTVPLLAAAGLPVLQSLACAQAQSIVIATVGALGYLFHGTIDWPLAALIGVPELAGVLIGWKIAHALPARVLRIVLIAVLCVLAVYLVIG